MANKPPESHARWRQARHAELSGPDSWLGLVGLFWLEPGANRVGSGEDCPVRLPGGPALWGVLDWRGGQLCWHPAQGETRVLQTDREGLPSLVEHENWAFFIVERNGRLAVRLRDRDWASRQPFSGIDCYDYDPAWRIVADWQPLAPPLMREVPDVTGELKAVEVAFKAAFEVAGQPVELLPMSVGPQEVFFVLRDRSSGRETYGAGRFLKAKPAANGKITLDFNFAFNPPCAFTPFATCPLPPPENWLGFEIAAGERM